MFKLTGKSPVGMDAKCLRIARQLRDMALGNGGDGVMVSREDVRFFLAPLDLELHCDTWEWFSKNVFEFQAKGVLEMDQRETVRARNEIVEKLRIQIKEVEHHVSAMVLGQLEPLATNWLSEHAAWAATRTFTKAVVADIIRDAKSDHELCTNCGYSEKRHKEGRTGRYGCTEFQR